MINDLLASQHSLTAAISFILGALLIISFLFLRPGFKVGKNRRRAMSGKKGSDKSGLSQAADFATDAIDSVLEKRGSGLGTMLDNAGLKLPAKDFVFLVIAASVVLAAVGLLFRGPIVGLLLAFFAPVGARFYLSFLTGRRKRAFGGQLDATLQMMASSLRAGYSLLQALQAVGQEAESPTKDEFSRVINETRVGRNLQQSLLDVSTRMSSEDFFWVSQAIAINREVGGNLADVLDGVAHTIRERNQLIRQVAALSAEGKLSAMILMGLPFAVAGFLAVSNPGYLNVLFVNPFGWAILGAAAVMMTVGGIWLRATVQIKY